VANIFNLIVDHILNFNYWTVLTLPVDIIDSVHKISLFIQEYVAL